MHNVAEAYLLHLEVMAYCHSNIGHIVEQMHPDCILIGPTVKCLNQETNRRFKETAPVAVIDASDYGMMNGERVLKTAIKLIKSFKK